MNEIMDNAVEASVENNHKAQRKNDENKRLINDCNEMLDNYKDELIEVPKEIEKVNYKLMLLTMKILFKPESTEGIESSQVTAMKNGEEENGRECGEQAE